MFSHVDTTGPSRGGRPAPAGPARAARPARPGPAQDLYYGTSAGGTTRAPPSTSILYGLLTGAKCSFA